MSLREALPARRVWRCLWAALACAALLGCAYKPTTLDPFGRPPDPANDMPTGPLRNCGPADADFLPPYLESGVKPHYPIGENMRDRIAVARMVFTVGADGKVTPKPLDDTKGDQWFLRHGALATTTWKVRPAMKAGQAIEVTCRLQLHYILK